MREYTYYIDDDGYNILVRDSSYGVEELYRENPVWQRAGEYYWREIYLGQGFNCLWEISLEVARESFDFPGCVCGDCNGAVMALR